MVTSKIFLFFSPQIKCTSAPNIIGLSGKIDNDHPRGMPHWTGRVIEKLASGETICSCDSTNRAHATDPCAKKVKKFSAEKKVLIFYRQHDRCHSWIEHWQVSYNIIGKLFLAHFWQRLHNLLSSVAVVGSDDSEKRKEEGGPPTFVIHWSRTGCRRSWTTSRFKFLTLLVMMLETWFCCLTPAYLEI